MRTFGFFTLKLHNRSDSFDPMKLLFYSLKYWHQNNYSDHFHDIFLSQEQNLQMTIIESSKAFTGKTGNKHVTYNKKN